MQARRILLFFGIVLLLTAAAASLVPVPEEVQRDGAETSPTDVTEPPGASQLDGEGAVGVNFRATGGPESETVEPDAHVVVTVEARRPGQVEIDGLGRIQDVEPGTPAAFDIFTDRAGRFEVVYSPVEGAERRVGTLIVEPGTDGSTPRAAEDGGVR